jgi:hypothetical protein
MKHSILSGGTALAILMMTTAAHANLTADQVWANWQAMGETSGQAYTVGNSARSGDTLTLTDVGITSAPGETNFSAQIPELKFREAGDGTVSVTMSDQYPITVQTTSPSGVKSTNDLQVVSTGLMMTASGDPDAINYDYKADKIAFTGDNLKSEDPNRSLGFAVTVAGMVANYAVTKGEVMSIASTLSATAVDIDLNGSNSGSPETFALKARMDGVAGASTGAGLSITDTTNLALMLSKGFASEAAFTYSAGNMQFSNVDPSGATSELATTSQGGNVSFSLDKTRIAYGIGARGVTLKGQGSAIPLPDLSASYDEISTELLMPLAKGTEPSDFTLNTRLKGLKVSDMIWGLFDPAATLPRDAATLVIELSGTAQPKADLIDQAAMEEAMQSGPPVEINTLDINALQLTVAGAELKGTGALTFDNTKPPMLGGMAPMPEGKINLDLAGANALLGKLLSLGLIDPQVSMGFGMMSSMLARPGPAPDTLVSEIEFKDGKILANGQPLPFSP